MATRALVLTDTERALLQTIINQVRGGPLNRPIRTELEDVPASPDIYMALPPETGIPGLTGVGTGTNSSPTEGDIPGSAECNIYQLVDGALQLTGSLNQLVYNLSLDDIPYNWVLVQRTKFGDWVATPSAASSADEVREGVLLGQLIPATNALTAPSTAVFQTYAPASSGTANLLVKSDVIIVTNRLTGIVTIATGTWLVVRWINNEWRPIVGDCGVTTL